MNYDQFLKIDLYNLVLLDLPGPLGPLDPPLDPTWTWTWWTYISFDVDVVPQQERVGIAVMERRATLSSAVPSSNLLEISGFEDPPADWHCVLSPDGIRR